MATFLLFACAVLVSVLGSSLIKRSDGLRRRGVALAALALYSVTICLFAVLATRLPIALLYALWGGVAVLASTVVGWLFFGERMSRRRLLGLAAICLGVVLLSAAR